jgi:hypothetical protein
MAKRSVPLLNGVWEDVMHIAKLFSVSSTRMGSKMEDEAGAKDSNLDV